MSDIDQMIRFLQLDGHPLADILRHLATPRTLPRHTLTVWPELERQYASFLVSGLLRGYLLDIHGGEITECFSFQYGDIRINFFGSQQGRLENYVETLEETRMICFDFEKLMPYVIQYPELTQIFVGRISDVYAEQTRHKRILFHTAAMERYEWFLNSYPGLIDRVPHKYIASFLNITPVTLSRLRRTVRENCLEKGPQDGGLP